MTSTEQQEIDRWFDAVRDTQPSGTIAAMFWVRDGQIFLGRGDVSIEAKSFPNATSSLEGTLADLETVKALFEDAIDATIKRISERADDQPVPA